MTKYIMTPKETSKLLFNGPKVMNVQPKVTTI